MQPETKQKIIAGKYPLVGVGPQCPKCGSTKTYYSCLAQNRLCTSCGAEFNGTNRMQPAGTLKKIKTSEMGIYYSLDTGKVIFISHQDMSYSLFIKSIRLKFEDDWPDRWAGIKALIPEGPFPFQDTPRTREGMLLEDYGDLYWLTKADLIRCGVAHSTSERILLAISKSKSRPLGKVLVALGIRNVGREWANKLSSRYNNIWSLGRATFPELSLIPGLGATIASSILEFLHTEGNWKAIEKMRRGGVDILDGYIPGNSDTFPDKTRMSFPDYIEAISNWSPPSATKVPVVASSISGKTFMFTGRLETMTRAQAQATVTEVGGLVGSRVSKNTDYLVVGDKPGSKLGHAAALGVKRITEQEFYTLLNKEVTYE